MNKETQPASKKKGDRSNKLNRLAKGSRGYSIQMATNRVTSLKETGPWRWRLQEQEQDTQSKSHQTVSACIDRNAAVPIHQVDRDGEQGHQVSVRYELPL